MARSLPPMTALLAFEAAGSTGSFTGAARELGVTREAISMQIRQLECALGHALFNRQRRGVELTAAGHALHKAVSTGLHEIGASIEKLRGKPTTKVRVSTTVAFAGRWLLPRLLEFQSLHPEIDIEMIETDECLDLHKSGIDFAIRYGKGKWKHHRSTLLFEERFFPVCSPGYLEAVGHRRVQDFDDVTVFHLAGAAHAWEDWQTWFDLSERSPAGKVRGVWMQSFENILRAAVAGKGLALGWTHLVERELHDGDLVRPFAESLSTGNGYYIVQPEAPTSEAAVSGALRNWIVDRARMNWRIAPEISIRQSP